MKKISTLSLCFTFTGCFLGAGYMSGQEIYQFFGAFGIKGVCGLVFAVIALWVLGAMLVRIVDKTRVSAIDKTVVGSDNKFLLTLVGVAEVLMFFGTYFIMIAGAGALIAQVFPFPHAQLTGCALYTLLLFVLATQGIDGLVKIFTGAVPLLILFAVVLGGVSLVKMAPTGIHFPVSTTYNPMIPNFAVGAFAFSAYNFFCCVGVMCPVGLRVRSRRSVIVALFLGAVCLFFVAFGVISSLAACEGAAESEIPMLAAAASFGDVYGCIFAFLLFLAMMGAGLASLIPTVTYCSEHITLCEKHPKLTALAVSVLGFMLSSFGFSDLVGSVFSFFGYVSAFIILGVVIQYVRVCRSEKKR